MVATNREEEYPRITSKVYNSDSSVFRNCHENSVLTDFMLQNLWDMKSWIKIIPESHL